MIRNLLFAIIFCNVLIAQSIPSPAIEFSPKKYICYYSNAPLTIDGKLSESAWAKTEWTDNFIDIEGAAKSAPRFRTRVKMLWDEKYFYVAAELQEPDIWSTLKNRDDIIFYDNDFEIFIDPDGDTKDYCEFEMNALNTVWDLLLVMPYRDIEKANKHAWDIKGLNSGVAVHGSLNKSGDRDSCWTVEVAFPWEGFKEITDAANPPNDNDQWRINFSRVEWKTEIVNGKYQKQINPATNKSYPEDNWVWSPQGVVNMHYPEMWGYVQFSKEIVGSKTVSFIEQNIEIVKWSLRQIYYAEKSYFEKNKTYIPDLKKLGITIKQLPGYSELPVIECTTNLFEAYFQAVDGAQKIHIRNDGLTWMTQAKK